MFVSLTGQPHQKQDRNARKSIRAHVMHNYRDQQQHLVNQGGQKTHRRKNDDPTTPANKSPVTGPGQKLRFRLKPTGLVQTIPYRSKRKAGKENNSELTRLSSAIKADEIHGHEDLDPFAKLLDPGLFITASYTSPKDLLAQSAPPEYESGPRFEDVGIFGQNMDPWPSSGQPSWTVVAEEDADARKVALGTPVSTYKNRSWTLEKQQNSLSTLPLQVIGKSRTDPFSVLPFSLHPDDEVLLDRFQHDRQRSWCPINAQGPWFAFAMRDELMFHVTLYHWLLKFNDRANTFLTRHPRYMKHKLAAIRLVNQRLTDPIEATKDESLAAVTALASAETGFGTKEEAKHHMDGLEILVEMRGGIECLEGIMEGVLQNFIAWNDLTYSELSGDRMHFVTNDLQINQLESTTAACIGPCFRRDLTILHAAEPRIWQPCQGEVIALFHRIRQLCDDVEKRPFSALDERQGRERSDRFHCLERDLRALAQRPREMIETENNDAVWRSCAAAGLIYVQHMLRGLEVQYRMFDTLSQDLQWWLSLTGEGECVEVWSFAPELLTWALTVGTVISTGRSEHDWFLGNLAETCQKLGYVGWSRYRDTLANFLWVGNVDEGRYLKIWEQMKHLIE
jgi:Fungal specific transcription factor domain